MAKKKMTMDEAYTCPKCGGQYVNVGMMEQILDDARSEDISCMKCQSTWRVSYRMSDFNKKTLNITDTPLEDSNEVEVNADGVLGNFGPGVTDIIDVSIVKDDSIEDCNTVTEDSTGPDIVAET